MIGYKLFRLKNTIITFWKINAMQNPCSAIPRIVIIACLNLLRSQSFVAKEKYFQLLQENCITLKKRFFSNTILQKTA